jgi:hypothetical protein
LEKGGESNNKKALTKHSSVPRLLDLSPFCARSGILYGMSTPSSGLGDWTPEQLAQGRKWVETWKLAAVDLERIRRRELRDLDTYHAIGLLCGPADYTVPPHAPKPTSGLVEQQRWFMKAAGRE